MTIPFIAGKSDLELLQAATPFAPPSMEDHVEAIEAGAQALVESGARVDLVPLWAPLFLVWCDENSVDPAAADAFERWTQRRGLLAVSYIHYECGPIDPLIELEEVRSWSLRSVLAHRDRHSERGVASVWATAAAFLEIIGSRAVPGSELDVNVPTWTRPAHWHLDGSCCDASSPTLDHVHAALMEGVAIDGSAVLIEPAGHRSSRVRVWDLRPTGVHPLTADQARGRCEPRLGATLVDAWGGPARK